MESIGFKAVANVGLESPSSPGTAIAWRKSLPVHDVFTLVQCKAQIAKLGSYAFFNLHAPSGSDRKQDRHFFFSQEVFRGLCSFLSYTPLIAGDFNCVLSKMDVENGIGFSQKYCIALKDLVTSFKLVDTFRTEFPNKEEFTFYRPGKAASRLDRFYVPKTLTEGSNTSHVASLSDHCAALLKISLDVTINSV